MTSDWNSAGVYVEFDMYRLKSAIRDVMDDWNCNATRHRHLAAFRNEINEYAMTLTALAASMNNAATAPVVALKPLYQDPHANSEMSF